MTGQLHLRNKDKLRERFNHFRPIILFRTAISLRKVGLLL